MPNDSRHSGLIVTGLSLEKPRFFLGSFKQSLRIGHCLRKAKIGWLVEPNPIGVDQNLDAMKGVFEFVRL
jgi:hypothetical protein